MGRSGFRGWLGIALVSLLIANLAGSIVTADLLGQGDDLSDYQRGIGQEYVLVIDHAWTVDEWSSLYSYDIGKSVSE